MKTIKHQFTEFIPDDIEKDVLYISTKYKTTRHLCPCGCGGIVDTPLKPGRWKLIFDGDTISLHPSILFKACPNESHYWIKHNKVDFVYDDSLESFLKPSARKKETDNKPPAATAGKRHPGKEKKKKKKKKKKK
jgi:hypothetical protein